VRPPAAAAAGLHSRPPAGEYPRPGGSILAQAVPPPPTAARGQRMGIVLRTVLASEYNHPGDRRHRLSERVRNIHLDSCLKGSIVDDSLDYFE